MIRLLKRAFRAGRDLSWSAVLARPGLLRRAARAAVRPTLFGSWDRALHAAGLHADDIARYRTWDRASVVSELRELAADGEDLSSGRLRRTDPGLFAAAVRHFGSWASALRRARIWPDGVARTRRWSRRRVVVELRKRHRRGQAMSASAVRREDPALYGAALRHWGSYQLARAMSGLSRAA